MTVAEIAGWLGAIFTTLILAPQLIKAFRTKRTRDVSMLMIVLSIMGNAAWFVQALLTSNTPLMVCAVLIIIMSTILMVFKYNNDKTKKE